MTLLLLANQLPGGPILGAGEGIIGLIVVVLTIVSWLVNLISGNAQNKPQPVVRPKANRPPDRSGDQQRSQRPQAERKPQKPKPPPKRNPQPQPSTAASSPYQEQSRKPLGGTISERHLETNTLGQGVRQSVREHMQDHSLATVVAQDMKPHVTAEVQQHLGNFSPGGGQAGVAPASGSVGRESILAMFQNPQTMRQTMVANIVLSKPAALAKRST